MSQNSGDPLVFSNNYASFKHFVHAVVQPLQSCTSTQVNFRMFKHYNDSERWYFRIAKTLIKTSPTHQSDAVSTHHVRRQIQRERKTAATLFIATALFFVAWLPHFSVALVFTFCVSSSCNMTPSAVLRISAFVKWMQFTSSAVNPFVFAFRDSEIRETIYRLFRSRREVFASKQSLFILR